MRDWTGLSSKYTQGEAPRETDNGRASWYVFGCHKSGDIKGAVRPQTLAMHTSLFAPDKHSNVQFGTTCVKRSVGSPETLF